MANPILLAITAGTTDLQPLIRDTEGNLFRANITVDVRRVDVRRFHEALLDNEFPVRISDHQEHERLPEIPIWLPKGGGVDAPGAFDSREPVWLDPEKTILGEFVREDGRLVLVAPKLGHVWRQIRDENAGLASVLVFTTRRDVAARFSSGEPIALGKVLTEWFGELCRDRADLRVVEYLQGHDLLEDLDRGSPLSFTAARRIEAGLRKMQADHPDSPLTLANSGGPGVVKEFVLAAARLFFPFERISSALRTETGNAGPVPRWLSPADESRVRSVALWHVRHGGFVEAYGAALGFHDDPRAAHWVQPLYYAADLINRNLTVRGDPKIIPRSLRRITEYQEVRCLIPALRTEAALQRGHWPEVINWTLTFFDAFVCDAIAACLPATACLDDRRRQIIFAGGEGPSPRLLAIPFPALTPQAGGRYEYDAMGPACDRWEEWIDWPELTALKDAVQGRQPGMQSTKPYRNLNTHNRLTKTELDEACVVFRSNGLWAATTDSPGGAFMAQPVVSAALARLLKIDSPAALYRELVADLERLLLDPDA